MKERCHSISSPQQSVPLRASSKFSPVFFLFILIAFILFITSVSSVLFLGAGFTSPSPNRFANISGPSVLLRVNITHTEGAILNVSNVTFYVVNRTSAWMVIGINTSVNQTFYTFNFNTRNTTQAPDDIDYSIFANITNSTAVGSAAVVVVETNISNVTIDNTVPVITFVNTGGFTNPDGAFINASTALSFNFTVRDGTFRHLDMCNVTFHFTNSTFGGSWNGTVNFANNTQLNLSYTIASATVSEGIYDYRVSCRDNLQTQNTANTTARTITVDYSIPMINITFLDIADTEQTQFGPNAEVTLRCERTDKTAGVNFTEISIKTPADSTFISKKIDNSLLNPSTSFAHTEFTYPSAETQNLGFYDVQCRAIDRAGNLYTTNKTFEITTQAPPSSSAYAIPGFKEPIAKTIIGVGGVSNIGTLSSDGFARMMAETAIVIMTVNGEEHSFTILEVGDGYVKMEVASDPFEVRINEGETKEIDVDANGLNDLSVNLNMIYKSKADLVFTLLTTPTPTGTTPTPQRPGEEEVLPEEVDEAGFSWTTLFILLIVILLVVFFILHYVRRRQQGDSGEQTGTIRFTPKDLGMNREPEQNIGGYRAPSQPPSQSSQGPPKRPFY